MSLRQLCKETSKQPSKALLYFPKEMKTGIAPTRLILDKSFQYKEGSTVKVNWEGKKIQAEIVAVDGKSYNLSIGNFAQHTKILFSNICFSSSHITPKISILSTLCLVIKFLHLLLRELTLIVSLVTDSEEVLNQKDAEWSSKFVSAAEPSPSSNQSNLPAGKQKHASSQGKPRSIQVFIRYLSFTYTYEVMRLD